MRLVVPTLHHGDAFIRTFRNQKTTVRPDDEAVHTRLSRLRSRFTFKEVVLAVPAVALDAWWFRADSYSYPPSMTWEYTWVTRRPTAKYDATTANDVVNVIVLIKSCIY